MKRKLFKTQAAKQVADSLWQKQCSSKFELPYRKDGDSLLTSRSVVKLKVNVVNKAAVGGDDMGDHFKTLKEFRNVYSSHAFHEFFKYVAHTMMEILVGNVFIFCQAKCVNYFCCALLCIARNGR